MLILSPVTWREVQQFYRDFQKKSNCFEMPLDASQYIGIFKEKELIGYFIIQGYENVEVEIHQGYLKPEHRHFDLPKQCMQMLEEGCKKAGYKRMLLGTHNRFKAYLKFAKSLGYKPKHLMFCKEI